MRVLFDTNVVLDVLLRRGEWFIAAEALWRASQDGRLDSCVTASAITDVYYISRRLVGPASAREAIRRCLDVLTVLAVDHATLRQAYDSALDDFEDAVQISAAVRNGLDAIVTSDPDDYATAVLEVFGPSELVERLGPPPGPESTGA